MGLVQDTFPHTRSPNTKCRMDRRKFVALCCLSRTANAFASAGQAGSDGDLEVRLGSNASSPNQRIRPGRSLSRVATTKHLANVLLEAIFHRGSSTSLCATSRGCSTVVLKFLQSAGSIRITSHVVKLLLSSRQRRIQRQIPKLASRAGASFRGRRVAVYVIILGNRRDGRLLAQSLIAKLLRSESRRNT